MRDSKLGLLDLGPDFEFVMSWPVNKCANTLLAMGVLV